MASAARSLTNMAVLVPAIAVTSAASAAYIGHGFLWRDSWRAWATGLVTGPGRTSRGLLLLLLLVNLKSLPFVWTFRVFGAMVRHSTRLRRPLPRRALFHYSITSTHTSLLETDYNLHKSNSTYFSDLDISRTHLVMYLLGPGVAAAGKNLDTQLVRFPADNQPVPGTFGVGLGAVFCSFRKEIAPYQTYEIWSRILGWDRKWLYIVSHFVVAGKVKPRAWDGDSKKASFATEWTADDEARLQKHVIATAISKYVFKLGRYTVHPSYLVEASDLLPPRPGEGWRGGGPDAVGTFDDLDPAYVAPDPADPDAAADDAWDWQRVEYLRRQGMLFADRFAALDGAGDLFDGGRNGALGHFAPG